MSKGAGRRSRRLASVVTGVAALIATALAFQVSFAMALIPKSAQWTSDPWIVWPGLVILVVATVVLAAWPARTSEPATKSLVVGALPGAPPEFVERTALKEVRRIFKSGRRIAVVCALTGARGVGKTQTAAAYARRSVRAGCPLVAWVSAETYDRLLADLAEVARAVEVADPDGDSLKSAERLRDYLAVRTEPALLVVDNAINVDHVRELLPAVGATKIIITSTEQSFAGLGKAVRIGAFERGQSANYLEARTRLGDQLGAATVAEELDDLPLALAQAASVIQKQKLQSYTTYLDRLHAFPVADMLPRDAADGYPLGAAEAILLAVQTAEADDPSAHEVLKTLAVLAAEGTTREVLRAVVRQEEAALDRTLARLVEMSLLVWGDDNDRVVMHRLIARVLRDRAAQSDGLASTLALTQAALYKLRPADEHAWQRRNQAAELISHIIAVWGYAVSAFDASHATAGQVAACADTVGWAVLYLDKTADLIRAVEVAADLIGDCARVLGSDHANTLMARNNLALAYGSAGLLETAIALHERNLADSERVLGSDHHLTLKARNNLASCFRPAGLAEEAIALHERNLADSERVLGPDHADTLMARNNLALAYGSAGLLKAAIALHERNLADSERVLGPDHADTLASRNNLAGSYESAGLLKAAIALHERNLADCERVLGVDHPDTLRARNNLAQAYGSTGRMREAVALSRQALSDCERVLKPGHPMTQVIRENLWRIEP